MIPSGGSSSFGATRWASGRCRPSPSPWPATWPPGPDPEPASPRCAWPPRPSQKPTSGRSWNRPPRAGCARLSKPRCHSWAFASDVLATARLTAVHSHQAAVTAKQASGLAGFDADLVAVLSDVGLRLKGSIIAPPSGCAQTFSTSPFLAFYTSDCARSDSSAICCS